MNEEGDIPAHDAEAERRVLATILYWPQTSKITDALTEDDFYMPRHRLVLSLLRQQQEKYSACDELMLWRQLESSPTLQRKDAFELCNSIGNLIAKNLEPWNIENLCGLLTAMRTKRARAIAGARLLRGEDAGDLSALSPAPDSITTGAKLTEEVESEIAGVRNALAFTQWPVWSSTQCLLPGTLTLLCGSPGVSKSLMAMEALWRWILDGIPVAILALESGQKFHIRRAVAQKANTANFMRARWNRENALAARQIWNEHKDFSELVRPYVHSPAGVTPRDLLSWLTRMAGEKKRVCIIDPVSMMDDGEKPWMAHRKFINGAKRIAERSGMSVLCVTHPRNGNAGENVRPALENIPGTVGWRQFSDSVFWLQYKAPEDIQIATAMGVANMTVNRIVYCLKCRLDENPGRIGFFFDKDALTHKECGKLA